MPSSISSSKPSSSQPVPRTPRRAAEVFRPLIVRVLIMVAVLLVALELVTRLGYTHLSSIERRVSTEHSRLGSIRPGNGGNTFLLVGNSLLLFGVDMPLLKKLLPPPARVERYAIESTMLLDWQYGVRRVFADGAHPDVILLVMGPTQLSTPEIRGDYSAYYLFRTEDLPEIASGLHYDRTKQASLYFGRYSLFFAGRNNLRNFILNVADPAYGRWLHKLAVHAYGDTFDHSEMKRIVTQRLLDIKRTCDAQRTSVVLVIPPGFRPERTQVAISAAESAGVAVLSPVAQGEYPSSYFSDGFHLNGRGAAEFTKRLAPELAAFPVKEIRN